MESRDLEHPEQIDDREPEPDQADGGELGFSHGKSLSTFDCCPTTSVEQTWSEIGSERAPESLSDGRRPERANRRTIHFDFSCFCPIPTVRVAQVPVSQPQPEEIAEMNHFI